MLAIRMQRTGRKGHSQFRVVVQDSRFSPSSGRVVAYLGSYNPHSKSVTIDKEKAATYLSNGAQPSERVARLLKGEGISLPGWINEAQTKSRTIRNQDKLRRNRPVEEKPEQTEAESTEVVSEEPSKVPQSEAPAAEDDKTAEEPKVEEDTPVESNDEIVDTTPEAETK